MAGSTVGALGQGRATINADLSESTATDVHADAIRAHRNFAVWGIAAVVVVLIGLLGVSLYRTRGHLAYVIDDGGIHLSLAWNLAHHATWGVVPHQYESASSSPVWTLTLALFALVLPRTTFEYVPIVLSALAAAWLLVTLGREQNVLGTGMGWRRWLQMAAVAALAVGVLFVPGLTMTGMEHVLQCALVVQVVVFFGHAAEGKALNRWAYPLLALATLTRFETLFVAAGLALAQFVPLLASIWGQSRTEALARVREEGEPATRRAAAIALASFGAVAAFGLFNVAMGQEWFPNSIIHKTALAQGSNNTAYGVFATLTNMAADPLVLMLFAAAVVYVLAFARRGSTRQLVYATVLVVAVPLHSCLGHYGWYERYQAYLIALGVLFVLSSLSAAFGPRASTLVAIGVIALTLVAVPTKLHLLTDVPLSSKNTYLQRYQAGLFLQKYYRGEAVATSELGYISFFHEGPLTDVFGLGDHDVLARRRQGHITAEYFEQLMRDRNVQAIVVYPFSLWNQVPKSWTLVGAWRLDLRAVTAFDPLLQFWAPDHATAGRLLHNLEEWAPRLPAGIHTEVNPFNGFTSSLRAMPCC